MSTPINKNVSNDNTSDETLEELLNELSSSSNSSLTAPTHHSNGANDILSETDAHQYFLNKTKAIIEASVGAVQEITPYVVQGQSPKEIEALSKLVGAAAQALDTLNRQTLIDKKADRDEQLEKIRIEGKKHLLELKQTTSNKNITNNNVLVCSREDIMKKLFGENQEEEINVLDLEDK